MMSFERQGRKSRSTNRRHRLEVQRSSRVNEQGFVVTAYTPVGTYWGTMDPITEKQRVQYHSISSEVTHFARVNGQADVEEKDRLFFKGRYFEVLTVVNINELDIEKLITTKEIRPGE